MPVNTTAWVTALVFGAMLGWGLGRRDADRRLMAVAAAVTAAIGVAVWLTRPDAGSDAALAAVSMTFGGLTTVATLVITGQRAVT